MSENIYDDVCYADEPQSGQQMEMAANIVANVDAINDLYANPEEETCTTTRNLQNHQTVTGIMHAANKHFRLIAACLLVLCVLLLIAIIVLSVKSNTLAIERDHVQEQKDELQEKVNKLGWIFFASKLYYVSTEKKNWTESRQDCRMRGLDLVIINCKVEQEFVENLSQLKNDGVYIGLTDLDNKGMWKWVDGSSLTTAYWSSGNGFAVDEDCVVNGYNGNSDWYDRPCAETFYWICE